MQQPLSKVHSVQGANAAHLTNRPEQKRTPATIAEVPLLNYSNFVEQLDLVFALFALMQHKRLIPNPPLGLRTCRQSYGRFFERKFSVLVKIGFDGIVVFPIERQLLHRITLDFAPISIRNCNKSIKIEHFSLYVQ